MKYSYDEKCLDLARYFYPNQSIAFLEALAQAFQNCVEGREDTDDKTLPIPDFLRNQENLRAERAAAETSERHSDPADCRPICTKCGAAIEIDYIREDGWIQLKSHICRATANVEYP